MKQLIYIMLLFPLLMLGQSAGKSNSEKEEVALEKTTSLKKEPTKKVLATAISANFNAIVISAYAHQSEQLIADFFNYLNLYPNSEKNDFQKEIDQSVLQMFFSESILLEDFIKGGTSKISLLQLLQYCKENNFVITVKNIKNTAVDNSNFDVKYELLVTNQAVTKTYHLSQKVYLFPTVKQFGETQKQVWDLKLGEINVQ